MAWSGLTGHILCCQLNNFMANTAYIFWFNTACANKDFLLSYYSMSKRQDEILQRSNWQKGQVHFLKKHKKTPCWLERAQFLPSLPNTTQLFAPTITPQPWKGGISPLAFQNLSCLLFILPLLLNFTCPRFSGPKPFITTALWEEPRAPHEADRTRALRFTLNWNLPPRFGDSTLPALTARQLDPE